MIQNGFIDLASIQSNEIAEQQHKYLRFRIHGKR